MSIERVSSIIKTQTDKIVGAPNRFDFNDPAFTRNMHEWMRNNIRIQVITYGNIPYGGGSSISITKSINFQIDIVGPEGYISSANCNFNISQ